MDELDLFRDFRSAVVAPSADAERRASARLAQAIERRHGWGTRVLRLIRNPGRTTLAVAVLAGVAATALFVSSPWKASPGFLERAQAALTPPAGSILHYRYEETHISKDFGCTVTMGPEEIWIDQAPPHRYRALLSDLPRGADLRTLACRHDHGTIEVGGALDTGERVMFLPPATLTVSPVRFVNVPPDPVTELREAIRNGRAHHEGKTELDGRTVERIRVECLHPPCQGPPNYAYVDPETFALVREERPSSYIIAPAPDRFLRFDVVVRYETFEYLPRTAANLALTNIVAQHPDATGP
jgi:hypothetical protein